MSIGDIYIFAPIFLLNLHIYINMKISYNVATMGVEAAIKKLPCSYRRYVMAVPKANQRAVNKYVKNNYDRINVTMPKGRKDEIKAHAEGRGESVNAFINRAIDETMERDKL